MISGMVCILTHYIGLGHHVEMIMIGNIMLLIPGVLMTNSFRDFISGDMISGLLHFSEAIITAICIAAGFIFQNTAWRHLMNQDLISVISAFSVLWDFLSSITSEDCGSGSRQLEVLFSGLCI